MKPLFLSLSLSLSIALLSTGCMGVPKTKVSFNPATGEVAIASPKNIALESAEFTKTTVTKGGVSNIITAKVKGYSSTNSVEALKAIAEANANSMAALAKVGQDTLATAIKAAK